MRLRELFENTNDIVQPTNLSPRDLQRFNRAVQDWLATRPWGTDVRRLNDTVDFYNRASDYSNIPPLLPQILDFIEQHPGMDAPRESQQVREAPTETVGLIFGRFNPPHKGHKNAWEMAAANDEWFIGTNESTVGPKDPLPAQVKVVAMETIMPEAQGHIVFSQSWLTLASELYSKFPNATLKLYTDEAWVPKTINQYNGTEGPHGMYNFDNIEWIKTPRLASATDLRKAVLDNSPEEFAQAAGVPADTIVNVNGREIEFFDLVAEYLEPHREKLLAKGK